MWIENELKNLINLDHLVSIESAKLDEEYYILGFLPVRSKQDPDMFESLILCSCETEEQLETAMAQIKLKTKVGRIIF